MEAATIDIAHPRSAELAPTPTVAEKRVGWLMAGTGLALFFLMMLLGITMRMSQADMVGISDAWFYRLVTLHGAGMLVGALLVMMGALWFVLRPIVELSVKRLLWAYGCIVAGAVLVLVAAIVGGFATGWTFLSPLPFYSSGQWATWATATFFVGMVLVGVGFFLYCIELFTATTSRYGGMSRALGIPYLLGRTEEAPPPQVLAATVVAFDGLVASAGGTTILIALINRTIDDGVLINALWAKNLTYFYGHTIANLIIYLAAGAIYVLVPRYAGRPWKTTKPLAAGWLATLLFVLIAFSHHLYMDFAQPGWAQYVSMGASSAAAIPVAVVTIYTGMMLIWGSRYRWTLASMLFYLGFLGWAIGGIGAVLDSLIPVNFSLHNTLWVPAHFHTYLLTGVMFWALAFVAHLAERAAGRPTPRLPSIAAPVMLVVGGYMFVGSWYASGALGVPRRYALHPPGTQAYDVVGSIGAILVLLGFLVFVGAVLKLVVSARTRPGEVSAPPRAAATPLALVPPVRTSAGFAALAGLAAVCVVSLLPGAVDLATRSAEAHHLDHTAQFLLGGLVALGLGSRRALLRPTPAGGTWWALVTVVAAPAVMLLVMTPAIYKPLEDHDLLHLLYHWGIIVLGLATGWASVRFGRVSGMAIFVLSVSMGAAFAGGVGG
ncbi:MAG: cbb3-type cytochrome c oxidase subunit I [Solirubrobacteraceae bacterium]|nr:cbb3-type cytochrome c oxidase subunit I [Solirubrobacteraceae bacterium]